MNDSLLIQKLQNAKLYNHPIKTFQVIETHLSWVILTGDYAYKIKKPVNLKFVDFSTLEKRRFYCEKELELNQPFAKDLYLGVIPITGTHKEPELNGQGSIIEYAIKMKEFNQTQLLSEIILYQEISQKPILSFAKMLANFHLSTQKTDNSSSYGTPQTIWEEASDNFKVCFSKITDTEVLKKLNTLQEWVSEEFNRLSSFFEERKTKGFIRNCHGDVHLGNMILQNDHITLFDRLEFNEEFRWIDLLNEIAFLVMDFESRLHTQEAFYFLNQYLEITGDYSGLKILRFYKLYRAMIRAKVALLSGYLEQDLPFTTYLNLADTYTKNKKPILIILCGVSGSGKSFTGTSLAAALPAIKIQADVERKRLFSEFLDPSELYSQEKTNKTYQQLKILTQDILNAGFNVIVDATFLKFERRKVFENLAKELSLSFKILYFEAAYPILKERVLHKSIHKEDMSDATLAVLDLQVANQEPLTEQELLHTIIIKTDVSINISSTVQNILR